MASFKTGGAQRMRIEIQGEAALTRAFNDLVDDAKGSALLAAVDAGAEILEPAMKAGAPRLTGLLASEIKTTARVVSPTRAEAYVGLHSQTQARYGIYVELGHNIVRGKRKKDKKIVGTVPAKPFMRRALADTKKRIANAMGNEIAKRMERARGNGR